MEVDSGCRPRADDIWRNLPFTCNLCMAKLGLHKTRKFSTAEVPKTVLANKIQTAVNEFLKDNNAGVEVSIRSFSRRGVVEPDESESESDQSFY